MTQQKSIYVLSAFCLFICSLFIACDDNRLFEENKRIVDSQWAFQDVKSFRVDVQDTIQRTNFYVNIRNADEYAYSNLYLFMTTTFPNGKLLTDTLECLLANEKGQWLGSGVGDIYENQILFKRNVIFPIKGEYLFDIQHGMRSDTIPLIMDVGLRIETVE